MSARIMNKQCSTCIFGSRSPLTPERLEEYKALWANEDRAQQCHTATILKDDAACRGHYEAARRDELPYPTQGIAESMGLGHLSTAQQMEIFERMGLIQFVAPEDKRGQK